MNPADPLVGSGKYAKEFGTHLPLIPGCDVAGVVEKAGAKVSRFKPALKPESLDFIQTAAVPLAALTAWQALVEIARISA